MELADKSHWVFDLDGTLTLPVHDFVLIRQELGIDPAADILETIAAQSSARRCTMLEQLDRLERHYAALAQPAEGALALLQQLSAKGCNLGILTRNTKSLAILSLEAIGARHFFAEDDILGRDEISPKPAPDGINFLLNQWDADRTTAVMVGDFHFYLLSGRAAGVTTVHVDSRDRHWPEDTDVRANSLLELSFYL